MMKLKPLVSLLAAVFAVPVAMASANGVVISQIYGGGGGTSASASFKYDYVELFNGGSAAVDVNGYSVQYASSTGNFTGKADITGTGFVVQPGRYLLLRVGTAATGAGANTPDVPNPDITSPSPSLAQASGKVALVNNGTLIAGNFTSTAIIDLVGYGAAATKFEGTGATGNLSIITSALRKNSGCTDSDNNTADFDVGTPAPRNSATAAFSCSGAGPVAAPIVPTCLDGSAVAGAASSFNVTATDADSKVITTSLTTAAIPGITLGSLVTALNVGDVATQPINIAATVGAGSYNLGLLWGNDQSQTASCAFKVVVSGTVTIPQIQGSGATSPKVGEVVNTSGIVTQLLNNGFYLQDPVGDGNPATSDGVFVFTGSAPTVAVGDSVKLGAKVAEFTSGSPAAGTLTELTNVSGLTILSSNNSLPLAVDVDLSTGPDLERYEGMRVRLHGGGAPLMVQQTNFVGAYGQLTIAGGGRTLNPTNIMSPGAAANAAAAANRARSILLDDASSLVNPNPTPYLDPADNTVRAGDTLTDVTGVIDFGPATASASGAQSYKIHPEVRPVITRSNARTAVPAPVGGNVRVASANVLNFFTTFTDGKSYDLPTVSGQGCALGSTVTTSNCRGADNLTEFTRQRAKIVASLSAMNADVVGLMEIQNNGNTAVLNLLDGLNSVMGAGTYAAVPIPAGAGATGTDAIRVAMIYKPTKLSLAGASVSDTATINNRPPLGQGFVAANGEKFAVIVNHLKSKGSCPSSGINADQGDLQGCFNDQRKQQATRLLSWLPTVTAAAGTPDVILLGDFNAYAKEDPIAVLIAGGIVDLIALTDPADYSYVFDAFAGRLDQGLGTASIVPKITGARSWHINADEPELIDYNIDGKSVDYYSATAYRSSDHDPLILGLNLVKTVSGTSGRDVIVGTDGDDVIEGGPGADTLTGGKGRDQFVYSSMADVGDTITDFTVGEDILVFTKLLQSLAIVSADPLASGHVTCTASAAGAIIGVDTDGSAGPVKSRAVLQLRGVACAAVSAASFKF